MIRLWVHRTDEGTEVDLRTDAPYSPDVLTDMANRALALLMSDAEVVVDSLEE